LRISELRGVRWYAVLKFYLKKTLKLQLWGTMLDWDSREYPPSLAWGASYGVAFFLQAKKMVEHRC
jgi:hypothetical protein